MKKIVALLIVFAIVTSFSISVCADTKINKLYYLKLETGEVIILEDDSTDNQVMINNWLEISSKTFN